MGVIQRLFGTQAKSGASCVQSARREPEGWATLDGLTPLKASEHLLYERLRRTVPIIDAAIQKIVRLTGGFQLECDDSEVESLLRRFAAEVRVGGAQSGLDAFVACFLDDLLTYGNAAGEIVLDEEQEGIFALYNSPLENLEVATPRSPVEARFYLCDGIRRRPVPLPELILFSALNPPAGEVRGVSLLRGLPLVGGILLRIYECMGKNFERAGNVRFAVTYKPGEGGVDAVGAREIAQDIAKEWGEAMSATTKGNVRDFVAVGDVSVKVIGADSQIIETKTPVDQMLQQIVSKLGLPPFLLGLSWSTTERMSKQQADILTSELEAYRRLLTPVVQKICRIHLALEGISADVRVNWDMINLQDELETAQAQLMIAQTQRETEGSVSTSGMA